MALKFVLEEKTKQLYQASEESITFSIPLEQQYRPGAGAQAQAGNAFAGTASDRAKATCQRIMSATSTKIEYSNRKDKSITIVVTGKGKDCQEAKKQIMAQMTQQGQISVFVPKEHHRFILGKGAETLKKLEQVTGAKISVPKINPDAKADEPITITGAKEAMQAAKIRIEEISNKQLANHRETFDAPVWTHPFIRGGNDSNLQAMRAKHGILAIDVPPRSDKTEIVVRGPQAGAQAAAKELKELVKRKETKCNPVTITVDKKQHKFVIGPRGKNIQDVLEKTGVSVEVC